MGYFQGKVSETFSGYKLFWVIYSELPFLHIHGSVENGVGLSNIGFLNQLGAPFSTEPMNSWEEDRVVTCSLKPGQLA